MEGLPPVVTWPPLQTLMRLMLALAVGLFVGLEREWRGKEAGLRTFGFVALMGGIGGLLGAPFALLSIAMLGVLLVFLNWPAIKKGEGAELTTSAALLVTGFTGVMCGQGHTVTPAAVAVVAAGLLAWKERLAGFSHKISAEELRSAILLAILAFGVYPMLPDHPVDPWGLITPRTAWVTVVLIAAIGFVNYVLWKMFGTRGVEITGFLGGLVNSTVTVTELSHQASTHGTKMADTAYRGVLLATTAMALRNGVLLGMLSTKALIDSALPLVLILLSSIGLSLVRHPPDTAESAEAPALPLKSPFSLPSALKFGLIFLCLQIVGTIGQQVFGKVGFYGVSLMGGLVSSASFVASAVNVVLVARVSGQRPLALRVGRAMAVVCVLGVIGSVVQATLHVPFME